MITRFQVDGFKNLVGVDLHFGPFTCIAGGNGAGKSNLFDAIRFLGELASRPLMEAAATVRDNRRAADVRMIFHRAGSTCADRMRFDVEMIVPSAATDDVGQTAKATTTFLRYELELGLRTDTGAGGPTLEIRHEALLSLKRKEAAKNVSFRHNVKWRDSVVLGGRRAAPYVSTGPEGGRSVIRRHQDGGSRGNPVPALAESLKGTIASVAQADAPTLLCARREMQSWLLLQLEPTALRQPSSFNDTPRLQPDGKGLAATLARIARASKAPEATCARIANRLAELIHDVSEISIDRNENLELLTLMLTDRQGTKHAARALSDGTLRFLALSVLEMDTEAHGVLCLEEPENGIHPDRIKAMMDLLQDIALDPTTPLDTDNPLCQVIVNTHSPLVVSECPDDSLVLAKPVEDRINECVFSKAVFQGLDETWRAQFSSGSISKGELLSYLSPVSLRPEIATGPTQHENHRPRRIRDRFDMTMPLRFTEEQNHAVAEE